MADNTSRPVADTASRKRPTATALVTTVPLRFARRERDDLGYHGHLWASTDSTGCRRS